MMCYPSKPLKNWENLQKNPQLENKIHCNCTFNCVRTRKYRTLGNADVSIHLKNGNRYRDAVNGIRLVSSFKITNLNREILAEIPCCVTLRKTSAF